MHSQTTKDQFVELRAAGKTFGEIAEQLGVSKSTLHGWAQERADDIARFRRIQWEEWEAEASCRIEQRLEDLACSICDYELRLSDFKLGNLNLRDTVMLLRESRREYYRLRSLLMGTGHSRKSNKTERSHENGTAQPRSTNDLQQPKSESFDFITIGGASSVEPQTSTNGVPALTVEPPAESDAPSHPPTFPPAHLPAAAPPTEPHNSHDSHTSQSAAPAPPIPPELDERPWWEREPLPRR